MNPQDSVKNKSINESEKLKNKKRKPKGRFHNNSQNWNRPEHLSTMGMDDSGNDLTPFRNDIDKNAFATGIPPSNEFKDLD